MEHAGKLAVVAVGGNALIRDKHHESIPDQSREAALTVHHIAEMIAAGWNVVITHGTGPQVGFILRRSELALEEVPPVPMDYADADLQGGIGYMFLKAFYNEFRTQKLDRKAVAIVTQTLVDRHDPACITVHQDAGGGSIRKCGKGRWDIEAVYGLTET
ncbi:MAG: hypothetical protein HP493_14525, partial [Nitrospira sp.]|nr:hypothetical protein [Nitrospira sp.]